MNFEKEETKDIVLSAVSKMNEQPLHRQVTYSCLQSGGLQKYVEVAITNECKLRYPKYNFYHPDDKLAMPDVWSDFYQNGCEIKVTIGKKTYDKRCKKYRTSYVWQNGTSQKSTENFVFIKAHIEEHIVNNEHDDILVVDKIYIGRFSYLQWKLSCKRTGSLYITETDVKKYCEQIV